MTRPTTDDVEVAVIHLPPETLQDWVDRLIAKHGEAPVKMAVYDTIFASFAETLSMSEMRRRLRLCPDCLEFDGDHDTGCGNEEGRR